MSKVESLDDIKKREYRENQGNVIEMTFDDLRIALPLRFIQYVDTLQTKIERLETQMHYLRNQYAKEKLNISDDMAEELIVDFIKESKARGVVEIDVLDIADSLKLPFDQIRKIMDKLKDRGIKEVE